MNPRPLRLSVRNGQKVQVTTTGFEPVTLRMMVSIVTTRPTNIDVDELRAHARVLIANANIFFPGSRPGCDWPFFRSYRRSAILFIFAWSFFSQEEFDPLWLFLFLSGHENEPLGLRSFHKPNPQLKIINFEPPLPAVLDAR